MYPNILKARLESLRSPSVPEANNSRKAGCSDFKRCERSLQGHLGHLSPTGSTNDTRATQPGASWRYRVEKTTRVGKITPYRRLGLERYGEVGPARIGICPINQPQDLNRRKLGRVRPEVEQGMGEKEAVAKFLGLD